MAKMEGKRGLVLSGGGVRGLAHLGVWKALQEKNVQIDCISGTSAGSLVGAFIAAGFDAEHTFKLFEKKGIFDFARVHFPSKGLLELKGLETFLENELPYKRIEDLPIPLIVTVSEIHEGKVHYFSEGPLARMLTASSCIPVLFTPIAIDNNLYVDGGLFDNLPIKALRGDCEQIIAVNATPSGEVKKLRNIIEISQRVFELGASTDYHKKDADILIEPKGLIDVPLLDGRKAEMAFRLGYEASIEKLEENRRLVTE